MIKRASFLFVAMLLSIFTAVAGGKYTLVIDAGHGGKDPGALGAFSKEKDINLAVTLAFGRYVEQYCSDVKVIYTRKTDVFVELKERANIANRNKADLFISIHTNSAGMSNRSVHGFQTYTLGLGQEATNLDVAKRENSVITMESNYKTKYVGFDPNSPESTIMFEVMQSKNMENSVNLAKLIQKSACIIQGRLDKGVHQANLCVLRETSMPACLVELGFITNAAEEADLNDAYIQDQLGRALYQAFVQYKDRTSGLRSTGKVNVPAHVATPVKPAPVVEEKPAPVATPKVEPVTPKAEAAKPKAETAKPKAETAKPKAETAKPVAATGKPVFKIQILSCSTQLKENDSRLGGLKGVEFTKEDGVYRYTYGSTTDYNEIYKLRESIRNTFPNAFFVAFKDGKKMVLKDAIDEWKKNK